MLLRADQLRKQTPACKQKDAGLLIIRPAVYLAESLYAKY
jgi:hypothetical protein